MNQLTVCVIGCGTIGEVHVRTYHSLERIRMVLCDTDERRLESLSRRYSVSETVTCFEEALRKHRIDIVDICLPHDQHVRPVLLAAQSSKHILLEKPIARNLKECAPIIQAVRGSYGKFMVAECWHFYPYLAEAKELIDRGEIGEVFLIQVNSMSFHLPPVWRRNREIMGGGVLIDRGVHFVDMLLYLGGPVDSVYAQFGTTGLKEMEGEDTCVGILRFRNGILGQISISWATRKSFLEPYFTVYGTKGSISARRRFLKCGSTESGTKEIVLSDREISDIDMIDLTIRHFIDCVEHDVDPAFTPEMAVADLEIVEAMTRSHEQGEAVRLPLNPKIRS